MAKSILWRFKSGAAEFSSRARLTRGDVLDMLARSWLPVGAIVCDHAGVEWTIKNYSEVRGGRCVIAYQCLVRPEAIVHPRNMHGGADRTPCMVERC